MVENLKAALMWEQYRKAQNKNLKKSDQAAVNDYSAWSFGGSSTIADELADLVNRGIKTATASAFPLYESEKESIPKVGEYSVILTSEEEPVCIIRLIEVEILPFNQVSAEQAFQEGEGDRSLEYWRRVHKAFFENELKQRRLKFTEEMQVVCEKFKRVF